jgi:hypothetical protein
MTTRFQMTPGRLEPRSGGEAVALIVRRGPVLQPQVGGIDEAVDQVARLRRRACTMPRRSPLTSVTPTGPLPLP